MLYACDGKWWKQRNGVPDFLGLKISQDVEAVTTFHDVKRVRAENGSHFLVDQPGVIATGNDAGGNSGFQAINLAIQFGARRIVIVGFDMRVDLGFHWHGRHKGELGNPKAKNVLKWRHVLDAAAAHASSLGVEILNASPVSALTAYPLVKIEDVL